MKKLFMLLSFILSGFWGIAQNYYTESQFRKIVGCKDDETISECRARVRNIKVSREDSLKREAEWKKYEEAKRQREEWLKEKERRDRLTPEQREKEDLKRRLESEAEKKKVGDSYVELGLLNSNISGNEPNYNPLLGVQLGIHTQVLPLSDNIHLGVGLQYSMQGAKSESHDYVPGGNYSTSSVATRLSYLSLPVLIRYQRNNRGFFAEAGLRPGLLLSAKKKGDPDVKDNFKKLYIGIPIGVGYKFKNKIGVGVQAIPGLMNINKNDAIKNKSFVTLLNVSYSL